MAAKGARRRGRRARCAWGRLCRCDPRDPRRYVREYAIEEFGRVRDTRAVRALLALLSDKDYITRRYAPIALAQIGTEEARAGLFEGFRRAWTAQTRMDAPMGSIRHVRRTECARQRRARTARIAEALVIAGQPAIEPLMAALRDGSEEVVTWVTVPLGALGAVAAVPLMLDRLTDDNHAMRGHVREAIRRSDRGQPPRSSRNNTVRPLPVSSPSSCSGRFRAFRLR